MLLELRLPITDLRIDAVLVGSHPGTDTMAVVIVENKQWSRAHLVPYSELVSLSSKPGARSYVHPINQAWGYQQVLKGFVPLLRRTPVRFIANLHNAGAETIEGISLTKVPGAELVNSPDRIHGRMFGGHQREAFAEALRQVLSDNQADEHAQELLSATVRSTEPLMSAIADGLGDRTIFPMLNEQREAYDYVRGLLRRSRESQRKEVVLIVGEPGTGKSVVALELMRSLNTDGTNSVHATGSQAFTRTLRKQISGTRAEELAFAYFNDFTNAAGNSVEVLIADEAHRLRSHSKKTSQRPQVVELIETARVPVFLLDDHQSVRSNEVGSVALVHEAARNLGLEVHQIDLRHQFRCGGAPEYIEWIDRLLGLVDDRPPEPWAALENFELRVAPNPLIMEDFLRHRFEEGFGARISAGYCWPWNKPESGRLLNDIVIGDWKRPWNSSAKHHLGRVPPSFLWATDPGGIDQVGCVYTAQGFEYDYAGVIFGNDLVWRNGRWRSDPRANRDNQIDKGRGFDLTVRKIYRILATRGLKGAVFYSTDPETTRHFVELGIPKVGAAGARI
ncbi:DUF2075 domain-containing protein [Nocardiopsis alba]|uniref:DUF2075 domain-containing protein n=1 Tax=Nocardiopsis alba TaxID=53437 RepID=A0A7K2IYD1_9ACTN|nr:DUF2075 domain-containing protein [Nocardiopsis alba]MYR34990.1 DUF2075 domain-containing protein [Nocardiopsis alba]